MTSLKSVVRSKISFSRSLSSHLSAPSRDLPQGSTASSFCVRDEMEWSSYPSRVSAAGGRQVGSHLLVKLLLAWLSALLFMAAIAWTREVLLKFASWCCYPATVWGIELCGTQQPGWSPTPSLVSHSTARSSQLFHRDRGSGATAGQGTSQGMAGAGTDSSRGHRKGVLGHGDTWGVCRAIIDYWCL